MGIGQLIDAVEESQNLAIVLEETNHGLVQSRQLLVRLVTARIVGGTAVEDIAAAIAALVLGNAFGKREAIDTHHQRALGIILGERGRTILRMGLVGVLVGGLIAVGARGCSLNLLERGQCGPNMLELSLGVDSRTIPAACLLIFKRKHIRWLIFFAISFIQQLHKIIIRQHNGNLYIWLALPSILNYLATKSF